MRKPVDPVNSTLSMEADLARRARAGDGSAFSALVERYQGPLRALLLHLARDPEHAADLVQDAVLQAMKNLDRYDPTKRFSTWFFRLGTNLAISARRRYALERRHLAEVTRNQGSNPASASDLSPLDALLLGENLDQMLESLHRLPQKQQDILRWRFRDGWTCQQIAERLGVTSNAVSILLHRARRRLQEDLGEL